MNTTETTPTLFIRKGKIMNTKGEIIAPEIGNDEHISLVKRYNEALNNGFTISRIEATISIELNFKCSCGKSLSIDEDCIDVDVNNDGSFEGCIEDDICGNTTTCNDCGLKYIANTDDDGDLIIEVV